MLHQTVLAGSWTYEQSNDIAFLFTKVFAFVDLPFFQYINMRMLPCWPWDVVCCSHLRSRKKMLPLPRQG